MRKQKSIKINFIMNTLLTISSFVFPLITFPYISRVLQPIGTGKVNFATSTIAYFSMFAMLGIPTYGIKKCAEVRDDKDELSKTVQELFIINLITAIVTYVVFFFALFLVGRLREERPLFLITSLSIFLNVLGMEWMYKALEQYSYITIRSFVFKTIGVIATFLLVHDTSHYLIYGGINLFASSASYLLNFFYARKFISFKRYSEYELKKHMRPILVFFAMACASSIYTNLDNVMLGFMKGDEAVGYYNACVRVKQILVGVVTSLGTVLLPRSAYYIENGYLDEFYKIAKKSFNFVFLIGTPIVVYFAVFSRECILLLAGREYMNAVAPMQIIMPTVLFIGLTTVLGIQMLVPLGKEKVVLYSEIAGAATDLVLNAILIPRMAATGAAIGTLVAEMVVLFVQYIALRNVAKDYFKTVKYVVLAIASILALGASVWTKLIGMNVFVALIVSSMLYFGVYGITMIVCKEPLCIEIIDDILGKIRAKIKH